MSRKDWTPEEAAARQRKLDADMQSIFDAMTAVVQEHEKECHEGQGTCRQFRTAMAADILAVLNVAPAAVASFEIGMALSGGPVAPEPIPGGAEVLSIDGVPLVPHTVEVVPGSPLARLLDKVLGQFGPGRQTAPAGPQTSAPAADAPAAGQQPTGAGTGAQAQPQPRRGPVIVARHRGQIH